MRTVVYLSLVPMLILCGGPACDRGARKRTPPADGAQKQSKPTPRRRAPAAAFALSSTDVAFTLRLRLGLPAPPKAGSPKPFDDDPPPTPRPLLSLAAQGCGLAAGPNPCRERSRKGWGLRSAGVLMALAVAPAKPLNDTIRRTAALAKAPPPKNHGALARTWTPALAMTRTYLPVADSAAFTKAFASSSLCKASQKGFTDWFTEKEKKLLPKATLARLGASRHACATAEELGRPAYAALRPLAALKPLGVSLTPFVRACFSGRSGARCDDVHAIAGVPSYNNIINLLFADPNSRKNPRKTTIPTDLTTPVARITAARARLAAVLIKGTAKLRPPAAWLKPKAKTPDLELRVNAAALARYDAAYGILQVFQVLGGGKPAEVHRRFGIGVAVALRSWRMQTGSTDLLRDFRLTVQTRGPNRGLRLRWKLTPLGKRTLGSLVKAVQGKNLLGEGQLLKALKDTLLPALIKAAPSRGILATDAEVKELVGYLSPFGRLLVVARLWPDLLRTPAGTTWLGKLAPDLKKAGFSDFRLQGKGDWLEATLVP